MTPVLCAHWEVWSDERTTHSFHEPPEPWCAWTMVEAPTSRMALVRAMTTKDLAEWKAEARRDGVNPFAGLHARRPVCEHGNCWGCGECTACLAPVIVPPSPSAAPGVVPVPRNTRQDGDDTETETAERELLPGAAPCDACGGTGLTGEQSYERISNEGGIWHNVICPACNGRFTPTTDRVETADDGFWRRLATREDFDPYRIER